MAQDVPFQCSMRVRGAPLPATYEPTAQQSDADTHVTPKRLFCVALALGEVTINQSLAAREASGALSNVASCGTLVCARVVWTGGAAARLNIARRTLTEQRATAAK